MGEVMWSSVAKLVRVRNTVAGPGCVRVSTRLKPSIMIDLCTCKLIVYVSGSRLVAQSVWC